MEYAERFVLSGAAALGKRPHGSLGLPNADYLLVRHFLDRINYVIHREDACAPLLPRTSNITAEEGVDAAFAFVEAGPAAGAFIFAVGGGAGAGLAADGTVAACGEGVHREVVEKILQLLCDDLSKYTPLVASDCWDSVVQKFASFRASGWAGYS